MPDDDGWNDYRFRRNMALTACALTGPAVGLQLALVVIIGAEWAIAIPFVTWAAFGFWAADRYRDFPCPWCGKKFFRDSQGHTNATMFITACRRCGFPKWMNVNDCREESFDENHSATPGI